MTRTKIADAIHSKAGFSKSDATLLLNQVIESSIQILQQYKSLKVSNFGSFKCVHKKSRIGRNPNTKKEFLISSRETILFRPSRKLKKLVNEGDDDRDSQNN